MNRNNGVGRTSSSPARAKKKTLCTSKRKKATIHRKASSTLRRAAFRKTSPARDPGMLSALTGAAGDGIAENPLFTAGIGLSALGMGVQILRKGALQGVVQLERHFTTSLEIPSKDRSYHWVLNWCTAQTKGRSQHVGVETRVVHQGNGVHNTTFDFVPSPGRHYIWYKRNLVQIVREREKMTDLQTGNPFETVKLTLFSRNRSIFSSILQEAEQAALQKEEGRVVIYMPMMTDWRPFGRPRPKRPIESVILDDGIAEFLQNDIKEFQRAGKWYKDKGIPHRRGYLLYGPPGSGKTSFIQALAGDLGYSICVLSLNDRGLSDDRLLHLMTDIPPRSILLLEDIDAVFNQRESSYSVTFSGLLNALDGVTSVDERLVFMTTNHLEKLDPALIRPGRVDAKVYVGDSTRFQQKKMFRGFFPDVTDCPFDIPENPVEAPTPTTQVIAQMEDNGIHIPEAMVSGDIAQDGSDLSGGLLPTTRKKAKKTQEELDEEYRAELALENKPLVEYMKTDNSELLTEGAMNRVKEQVEIEEIEMDGTYSPDGTTKRLSWDTIVKRVSPEFFDAVDQDLPMSARLVTSRAVTDDNDMRNAVSSGDVGEKTEEELRIEGLNNAKLSLQRELQELDNPVAIEIGRRQAYLEVININRAKKGLPALTSSGDVPVEFLPQSPIKPKLTPIQLAKKQLEQDKRDLRWKPLSGAPADKKAAVTNNTDEIKLVNNARSTPTNVSLTEPSQITPTSLKIDYRKQVKKEQNRALFSVMETERYANEFAAVLSGVPVSMAELQSLMLLYKDRPRMCIEGAKQLVIDKKERLEKLAREKQMVAEDYSRGNSAGGVIPLQQISIVGAVNPPTNSNATMKEQMFVNDRQRANAQQKALTSPFASQTPSQPFEITKM